MESVTARTNVTGHRDTTLPNEYAPAPPRSCASWQLQPRAVHVAYTSGLSDRWAGRDRSARRLRYTKARAVI